MEPQSPRSVGSLSSSGMSLDDWRSAVDSETQQTYIYNPLTKESQWLWEARRESLSGDVYYVNVRTGECEWSADFADDTGSSLSSIRSCKSDKIRRKLELRPDEDYHQADSGHLYAFNKYTGESRWIVPRRLKKDSTKPHSAAFLQRIMRSFLAKQQSRTLTQNSLAHLPTGKRELLSTMDEFRALKRQLAALRPGLVRSG